MELNLNMMCVGTNLSFITTNTVWWGMVAEGLCHHHTGHIHVCGPSWVQQGCQCGFFPSSLHKWNHGSSAWVILTMIWKVLIFSCFTIRIVVAWPPSSLMKDWVDFSVSHLVLPQFHLPFKKCWPWFWKTWIKLLTNFMRMYTSQPWQQTQLSHNAWNMLGYSQIYPSATLPGQVCVSPNIQWLLKECSHTRSTLLLSCILCLLLMQPSCGHFWDFHEGTRN